MIKIIAHVESSVTTSEICDEMDINNSGMPNALEIKYGLNPNDTSDATSDQDMMVPIL